MLLKIMKISMVINIFMTIMDINHTTTKTDD